MPVKPLAAIALVLALTGVVYVYLSRGPRSFAAEYRRAVVDDLARSSIQPVLAEPDLAHLPPAVQRYLHRTGFVGQPRVQNVRVRFRGRFRNGPRDRWMSFTGEQHNSYDRLSRFFLMDASMFGVPVQALHLFVGPSATMRVRVASLVTVADASGPEMDESETVTLFNDMCIFAPGALIDRRIQWQEIDARTVRGSFTHAGRTVHGLLTFDAAGDLIDFTSHDRSQSSADGRSFTKMRWSTPVRDYRTFGSHRLAGRGEARWHPPAGPFAYIEMEMLAVDYNLAAIAARSEAPGFRHLGD